MSSYYLTTAIDYSNGKPHVGHAYEKVGTDAIARYHRLIGDSVHFVIGMDEHGQSVAREAKELGEEPQAWVDGLAVSWQEVWAQLQLSHDDFIRTTEPRHARAVEAMVERLKAAGDIYLDRYEGFYCERCEAFRKEAELVNGRCPLHPKRDIQWTEEENYFFRLSAYRDRLLEHIAQHPEFVQPTTRRNEILRLLEGGLDDISASRSRVPWGVPFPGAPDHTVYVWLDAVTNYLSATGFPDEGFEDVWPAQLHVIGKDITRFHCVIWPAMLMAAGIALPAVVWAHGFVMIGGGKLSKSDAELLDLAALIERHGSDALRYVLLAEAPWDRDRDFPSADGFLRQFDNRYNADLANDLGNLLNRSVSMIQKYRGGAIPAGGGTELDALVEGATAEYHNHMKNLDLHKAIETAMSVVRDANGFIDAAQPWSLAKDPSESARLDDVLGALVRGLAATAVALAPFMPAKSEELWHRLGGDGQVPVFGELERRMPSQIPSESAGVLFPRSDQ